MPQINIKIRNKIAETESDVAYVCGNSDFVIVFDFDDEWLDYDVKTARFKYNGTYQDIIFHGNQIDVPVIENTYKIYIGVYAGDLHTTTPAVLNAKKSILSGSGTPVNTQWTFPFSRLLFQPSHFPNLCFCGCASGVFLILFF